MAPHARSQHRTGTDFTLYTHGRNMGATWAGSILPATCRSMTMASLVTAHGMQLDDDLS